MNYLTQTDNLVKGIAHGVASWIWDIISAPLVFIKIIKELICGELTISEVIKQGFEYFVKDIKYVKKHLSVFKATKKTSNKEVYNMGYHAGRVISMVATAISKGIGIANKFTKTKIGQKIIAKVNKSKKKSAGKYGKTINISEQKMYQQGQHYNKHGKDMGYSGKKAYEAGAREFINTNKNSGEIFEGTWNSSRGGQSGQVQIIIRTKGK